MRSLSQMNALLTSAVNELERVVTPELQRKSYQQPKVEVREEAGPRKADLDVVAVVSSAPPLKVSAEEQRLVEQLMSKPATSEVSLVTPRSLFGDAFDLSGETKNPVSEVKKPEAKNLEARKIEGKTSAGPKVDLKKTEPEKVVADQKRVDPPKKSVESAGRNVCPQLWRRQRNSKVRWGC
jgi:hypothetical protein